MGHVHCRAPAQCRPVIVPPSEELRTVEKLSQLLAHNSVGQRSSSDPSKHCTSFSSHSELSAVFSPWPARLPLSWPCRLTQAPGQHLAGRIYLPLLSCVRPVCPLSCRQPGRQPTGQISGPDPSKQRKQQSALPHPSADSGSVQSSG